MSPSQKTLEPRTEAKTQRLTPNSLPTELIINPPLSQYTLGVRVFHLAHLRNQVGHLDQLGMSVAAGANHVDAFWPALERFHNLVRVEHFVADGVIDFVEDHQIVLAAENCFAPGLRASLRQLHV